LRLRDSYPAAVLTPYADAIAARALQDDGDTAGFGAPIVRCAGTALFSYLAPEVQTSQAGKLLEGLAAAPPVRQQALGALATLPPAELELHTRAICAQLDRAGGLVCVAALKTLTKLPPSALRGCLESIVGLLDASPAELAAPLEPAEIMSTTGWKVESQVLQTLAYLAPSDLGGCVQALLPRLDAFMIPVRLAAMKTLSHLEPVALEVHALTFLRILEEDEEWGVRKWAAVALGKLGHEALAPHAAAMAALLLRTTPGFGDRVHHEHPDVRYAILRAMCVLGPAELDGHAAAIADPVNVHDDTGLEGRDDELHIKAFDGDDENVRDRLTGPEHTVQAAALAALGCLSEATLSTHAMEAISAIAREDAPLPQPAGWCQGADPLTKAFARSEAAKLLTRMHGSVNVS